MIHKYAEGVWVQLGTRKVNALAVDEDGVVWVVEGKTDKVSKWDAVTEKWIDMGLNNANYIAVGSGSQVYAVANSKVYKYTGDNSWVPLPGSGKMVEEIAVGQAGNLYITVESDQVFTSYPYMDATALE